MVDDGGLGDGTYGSSVSPDVAEEREKASGVSDDRLDVDDRDDTGNTGDTGDTSRRR